MAARGPTVVLTSPSPCQTDPLQVNLSELPLEKRLVLKSSREPHFHLTASLGLIPLVTRPERPTTIPRVAGTCFLARLSLLENDKYSKCVPRGPQGETQQLLRSQHRESDISKSAGRLQDVCRRHQGTFLQFYYFFGGGWAGKQVRLGCRR